MTPYLTPRQSKVYIDCPGTVLINELGRRCLPACQVILEGGTLSYHNDMIHMTTREGSLRYCKNEPWTRKDTNVMPIDVNRGGLVGV